MLTRFRFFRQNPFHGSLDDTRKSLFYVRFCTFYWHRAQALQARTHAEWGNQNGGGSTACLLVGSSYVMVLRSLYFLSQKYSNIPIGSRAKIGMKTSAKKQEKKIAVDVSKRNTALLLNRSTHLTFTFICACCLCCYIHYLQTQIETHGHKAERPFNENCVLMLFQIW